MTKCAIPDGYGLKHCVSYEPLRVSMTLAI